MRALYHLTVILVLSSQYCFASEPTNSPAPASVSRIEVFTVRANAPTGTEVYPAAVQVFVLDGIRQLEAELSHGLSTDRRMAELEVLSRLQGLDKDWQTRAKASAQALMRALELGITRYPAIVFEGRWVVYGLTDLDAALDLYRDWPRQEL